MTDEEKLTTLKVMLEEDGECCRTLTDERLKLLLTQADGDARRAADQGGLLQSRCTGRSLPDGVTGECHRGNWLAGARADRGHYTTLSVRVEL